MRGLQPPDLRLQSMLASDTLRGWAAVLVLLVWVRIVPPDTVYGVPLHLIWATIVGLAVAGVAIGARTARLGAAVVFGAVLVVLVLVGAVAHVVDARVADPYLRLVPRRGSQLLTALAVVVVLASVARGRRGRRDLRPAELMVVGVVALFLANDFVILNGPEFRDLKIYLLAGERFFHGQQPYLTSVMQTSSGVESGGLPFLYPPLGLPIFAMLSQLPRTLVIGGWLAVSLVTAVVGLRTLGIRPWWILVLLAWPPIFQGLTVGNVAVLTFGLFALAPRVPWALPFMMTFKPQSAVPSIWLLRERRWRSLAIGIGLLGAVVLLTLPIVGISMWGDWLQGLRLFQESQGHFSILYGLALPRYLPYTVFLAISVVAVVLAAVFGRGPAGLARLGIASMLTSPSLYRHGFPVMLPGLLGNGELVFWLGLALAVVPNWWPAIAVLAVIGTLRFRAASERPADTVHPLGPIGAPWSEVAATPGR